MAYSMKQTSQPGGSNSYGKESATLEGGGIKGIDRILKDQQVNEETSSAAGASGINVTDGNYVVDQGIHDSDVDEEGEEEEEGGIWSNIRGKFRTSFKDNTEALKQTKEGCHMFLMSNLKQQAIKWDDTLRNIHEKITRKK